MEVVVCEQIGAMICKTCATGIGETLAPLIKHGRRHNVSAAESKNIFESLEQKIGSKDSRKLRHFYLAKDWSAVPLYLPKIKDLPVENLFKCPTCSFCSETREGCRAHQRRVHGTKLDGQSCVQSVKGQAFWKKNDWRVFWLIEKEQEELICPVQSAAYDRMMEKLNGTEETEGIVEEDMRDRCAFANIADLDGKLKRLGISWSLAVELTSGIKEAEEILFQDLCDSLKEMVNNLFDIGRSVVEDGDLWRSPDTILRAVATPGTKNKMKTFRLLPKSSKGTYRNRALRFILFAARVWALHVSGDAKSQMVKV